MKNSKQKISVLLFALAVATIIWWSLAGANIYTKTSRMVQVKDDLFGTTTEKWEKDFIPGLDLLGPIAGVFLVAGGLLMYRGRKTKSLS